MKLLSSLLLISCLLISASLAVRINFNTKNLRVHKTIHHDTWVEEKNDYFKDVEMGSLLGFRRNAKRPHVKTVTYSNVEGLPTNFDARTNWPNCPTIGTVQNQAECGSCWAFGAIESISDRFCIHKNESVQLSFMDMVTCDRSNDGCEGGDALSAYAWVKSKGVVTADCQPYTIPSCPAAQQPCLNFVTTPNCVQKCANASIDYASDKHYLKSVYSVSSHVASIQNEIYTNGPVEACFTVYEDFLGYKSGVYQHKSGKALGGHCIKLVGFGVQNGTPYWLALNSWETEWGNLGTFLIRSGVDECGIESDVVAGLP